FQAEDGIRDFHVTGVQTCALPICWYMSGLASPRTAGHTGFTGTSLVIDFPSRSFAILLTNRVHPTRTRGSINPVRQAVAQGLAEALAVRPRHGDDAWFSGLQPATTATLDAP